MIVCVCGRGRRRLGLRPLQQLKGEQLVQTNVGQRAVVLKKAVEVQGVRRATVTTKRLKHFSWPYHPSRDGVELNKN